MIDQTLKTAFINYVEKFDALAPLVETAQKRMYPQVLAAYNKPVGNAQELINKGDWRTISFNVAQRLELDTVLGLSVLLTRLAFVNPEQTFEVMDALTEGWLAGESSSSLPQSPNYTAKVPTIERKVPSALQKLFWQQVEVDDNVIENVYNYPVAFEPALNQAYANAMLQHSGTKEAYQEGYLRSPMQIEDLQNYPKGTLGWAYYHQIVDNGLGIEILKGNQQKAKSGGVVDYVNQRTLQTHDLWHCLTKYSTDGAEEIALQAFQMAQLGNPFSPCLLAVTLTRSVLLDPATVRPLMRVISFGWQHGRKTPPLLPIKWEQQWERSLDEIRHQYQIMPRPELILA